MGAFDGAANAACGVDLYRRVHSGGGRSFKSSARDDALDVLGASRDDISVGSRRFDSSFLLAMEISILQAGSPPELIWPSPYLKKISVRQSLWPSPGQWLFFLAAQEDSPNSAPMWNTTRLGPNGQTSMNSWPGFLGHPGEDLSVAALADRMAMSRAILRGSFAARPDRRRPDLSTEHGLTRPAANSSKPPYRSQPSPRNAASATPNACGALFNACLTLVRMTTGHDFDHPRLCEV